MGHCRHIRAFLSVALYLLACRVVNHQPSLVVLKFGKLLSLLAFAGLLMFVLAHAADIRRGAVALFRVLRLPLLRLVVDQGYLERSVTTGARLKNPIAPLLFQRPPPFSSL
jgi:hypothetical protein